ncbi:MAG TPA: acyl-CoA ligase (AMP-forming), exosortase A system-associated [Micromonosporaceae bacterium]|nr:acyl-CoA ligase (AMP-forming), exosortase A system-associated [Micromonosporaceae bacterium]HCU51418.1 acyl-CoA ligase (AMP-forming), exosortase A system-associated [Micromonosporaceae bacterium]
MTGRIHLLLYQAARQRPDSPALIVRDRVTSYRQLAEATATVAHGLRAVGADDGDRVAVIAANRLETVVSLFAASAANCLAVPINPLLRPAQVAHVLADSGARVLVTTRTLWNELVASVESLDGLDTVVVLDGDRASEAAGRATTWDWESLFETVPSATEPEVCRSAEDAAMIIYTSGSTGRAKGVVLSHRNLLAGATSMNAYLGHTADDVFLVLLALSFDAGFSQLTATFRCGATAVLSEYLFPAEAVRLCARYGVSGIIGVPALWAGLVDAVWDDTAVRRVRYFGNTGGHLPTRTLQRLRAIFPRALPYLMYGLTEAFRSTYLDPTQVDRRPGSIGKAIPLAEVYVMRPDGTECEAGEVGELVHAGPLVALGYWNNPAGTDLRFRPFRRVNGQETIAVWSGDLVVRDDDGYLTFIARGDEMIKTRGYRVSPSEVEEVVIATDMVKDAVAFGYESTDADQLVGLAVISRPGYSLDPSVLLAQLRRRLPSYMVPTRIMVLANLPVSANGKYDRAALRETMDAG